MSDYKEYHFRGVVAKHFPDTKVIMLQPGKKAQKDDFLRLKAKIDTLLQIDGTKRIGNTFTLKLNDQFNVNIDEVLKSLGMKGGIEHEDAQSMVDDAAEESVKEDEKEQSPQAQMPGPPAQMPGQPPQQPEALPVEENVARKGVFAFLFEADMFQPGKRTILKKKAKIKTNR